MAGASRKLEDLLHDKLGTGLALLLAKTLFKANPVGLLTVGGIELALAKHVEGVAQQRKVRLFIEEISTSIVEVLSPLFDAETTQQEPVEVEAVVLALADALNATDLSLDTLIRIDFSTQEVAKRILESAPKNLGFDDSQATLFARAIDRSSEAVIDASRSFESFQSQAITEILRRLTEIQIEVKANIAKLSKAILDSQEHNEQAASDYEIHYRRQVERSLNHLEVLGVETSEFRQRQPLTVAYVSLSVTTAGGESVDESRRLDVGELLSFGRRVVVLGPAGSGKTTLIQWLAVTAVQDQIPTTLPNWQHALPFLVQLRSYANQAPPDLEELCDSVDLVLRSKRPPNWTMLQFENDRAILLVDGLDEISSGDKIQVYKWLDQILSLYPNLRIVVTARTGELDPSWAKTHDFIVAEMNEMPLPQVQEFIERWFEAKARAEETELTISRRTAATLFGVILSSKGIRDLVGRPLFCAMVCALYASRNQYLPRNRVDLYDACLKLLLDRRDRDRKVMANQIDVDLRGKLLLCSDLAFEMLSLGQIRISRSDAVVALDRMMKIANLWSPRESGDQVVEFLVRRAALLREASSGVLEFSHRTFQEFLAATRAVRLSRTDELIRHAVRNPGSQVAALAAGLSGPIAANEIIRRLLEQALRVPDSRETLTLMAVSAYELTEEPTDAIRARIRTALNQIVPPRSLGAADAMAAAGEIAVEYLADKNYPPIVAEKCIHGLVRVRNFAALSALAVYARRNDRQISQALFREWTNMPGPDYAKAVLQKAMALTDVSMEGKERDNVRSLVHLPQIKSLEIKKLDASEEFGGLCQMPWIENLYLVSPGALVSFDFLELFPGLKQLHISSAPNLRTGSGLGNHPTLEYLRIENCRQLSQLSELVVVPRLRKVTIVSCPNLDIPKGMPSSVELTRK